MIKFGKFLIVASKNVGWFCFVNKLFICFNAMETWKSMIELQTIRCHSRFNFQVQHFNNIPLRLLFKNLGPKGSISVESWNLNINLDRTLLSFVWFYASKILFKEGLDIDIFIIFILFFQYLRKKIMVEKRMSFTHFVHSCTHICTLF